MKHRNAQEQVMRLLGSLPKGGVSGDAAEYFLKLTKDALKEIWDVTEGKAERLTVARVRNAIERIPIGQARDWEINRIIKALKVLREDVISEAQVNEVRKSLYPVGRTILQRIFHLPHPTEAKKVIYY